MRIFSGKKTLCDGATTFSTTTLSILTRLNNNCAIKRHYDECLWAENRIQSVIMPSVIKMIVIMTSVRKLRAIIQSVIMPSVIKMIVIMTRVRKLRAIIRSVIMPSAIKMIVIMMRVLKLRAIIRSVIMKCHFAVCLGAIVTTSLFFLSF
jgi:hypothetical protein